MQSITLNQITAYESLIKHNPITNNPTILTNFFTPLPATLSDEPEHPRLLSDQNEPSSPPPRAPARTLLSLSTSPKPTRSPPNQTSSPAGPTSTSKTGTPDPNAPATPAPAAAVSPPHRCPALPVLRLALRRLPRHFPASPTTNSYPLMTCHQRSKIPHQNLRLARPQR